MPESPPSKQAIMRGASARGLKALGLASFRPTVGDSNKDKRGMVSNWGFKIWVFRKDPIKPMIQTLKPVMSFMYPS